MALHRTLVFSVAVTALFVSLIGPSDAFGSKSFKIRGMLDNVSMLSVLPGEIVPLESYDPASGRRLAVSWTAGSGTISHAQNHAAWKAPTTPGVYRLAGEATVDGKSYRHSLSAFVTVPRDKAKSGLINGYRVGIYPFLANRSARSYAALPAGFIKLDSNSAKTKVSPHFTLGQFAVKDGARKEKYMFLDPRLIDKLEAIIADMKASGYPVEGLRIMSGYRTPAYNAGIGNKTSLSRHTYGDAADVLADDWNGDGRITEADARILYRSADRLDRTTKLTGGLSLYRPNSAHGWFVHVDARGKAARW